MVLGERDRTPQLHSTVVGEDHKQRHLHPYVVTKHHAIDLSVLTDHHAIGQSVHKLPFKGPDAHQRDKGAIDVTSLID